MPQMLLFPDPRPLVERLGRDFFRHAPESAGVYLMRDGAGTVLYVGKAKNLRQRLASYRVANPDRMPRRHLRMLRAVERIDLEICADEASALARESQLLRSLRPKFNRAGTWDAPARFLLWRVFAGDKIQFAIAASPEDSWREFGPLGSHVFFVRAMLVRLLWLGCHPARRLSDLPVGWLRGWFEEPAIIPTGAQTSEVVDCVTNFFAGSGDELCEWVNSRLVLTASAFAKNFVEAELEECRTMSKKWRGWQVGYSVTGTE